MDFELLNKYNIPAPRYTSYPTVPYWQHDPPTIASWKLNVLNAFDKSNEISLYIHLPYCESLCTYCGCNKHITKNHTVELPYIESILQEWAMYINLLPTKPILRELHLGGGTPTFFAPEHLAILIKGILENVELPAQYDFGFEAHPNSTTFEHLQTLRALGFNRISIGVQDFDDEILRIINRFQTEQEINDVVKAARTLGYESINFDLIFGLPRQTPEHIRKTMRKVAALKPERIAFYSYAHVPWIKPGQRAYSEEDLPQGKEKRALYELGRELLEDLAYIEIGLDHFALPGDALQKAQETGTLHRNFMGYTPYFTGLSIGLGASSISDSGGAFVQNEKSIATYRALVKSAEFPIVKGHLLTKEDQILRKHILHLMCRGETSWLELEDQCDALFAGMERLEELETDGLVERFPFYLRVTPRGKPFVRNICLALDAHYWRRQPQSKLFSQTI
ncbi:MAG: oxygen-independent coproporphyrinogen III oxidase [Saprospiraceae bacterium]|nr:oxygen-independent coproporphyrinogen III oxidase [Saprospiraceae bacterium]